MRSVINPTKEEEVSGTEKDAFGQNNVVKEEEVDITETNEGNILRIKKEEDEGIFFQEEDVKKEEPFEVKSEDFKVEEKQSHGVKQEDFTMKDEETHFRMPNVEEDVLVVKEKKEAEDPNIPKKKLKKSCESLKTQYSSYKLLAPSGNAGAKSIAWPQLVLTRLQYLYPYTKKQESISNLMESGATNLEVASDDNDTGTSTSQEPITPLEEPITPLEEPSFLEATDCNPLAESPISGEDRQTEASSTPRPWGKRSRKTLDVFANEDSTVLMRALTKTLESIASKRTDDEIASFCKNLETRMRKLSGRRLPYILNDMENCMCKHLLEDQNQAQLGE